MTRTIRDASNAAVTAVTGPTASVHVAALEQALRHPAKREPASGVAVRVWRAPKSRRTVQLPPQSIEPPWTRPEPLPALRMWKRTVMVGGTWEIAGTWPSKPTAAQRARSAVIPQALPAPKSHGRYHAGGCGESGCVAAARLTSVPIGKLGEALGVHVGVAVALAVEAGRRARHPPGPAHPHGHALRGEQGDDRLPRRVHRQGADRAGGTAFVAPAHEGRRALVGVGRGDEGHLAPGQVGVLARDAALRVPEAGLRGLLARAGVGIVAVTEPAAGRDDVELRRRTEVRSQIRGLVPGHRADLGPAGRVCARVAAEVQPSVLVAGSAVVVGGAERVALRGLSGQRGGPGERRHADSRAIDARRLARDPPARVGLDRDRLRARGGRQRDERERGQDQAGAVSGLSCMLGPPSAR